MFNLKSSKTIEILLIATHILYYFTIRYTRTVFLTFKCRDQ